MPYTWNWQEMCLKIKNTRVKLQLKTSRSSRTLMKKLKVKKNIAEEKGIEHFNQAAIKSKACQIENKSFVDVL